MGQAKQRGTFEQRKASSKKTKFTESDNFILNVNTVDNYVQATFSYGDVNNQIVLKASDFHSLFHLLVEFSLDSLSLVDDFVKSANPSFHKEIHVDDDSLAIYFSAEEEQEDDQISDIFCTDLLPLTDELYLSLIKTSEFHDLLKDDFDSFRSMDFLFNPVRKSFQSLPEFSN
jgi:hypothetical protein